ncbi:ABC transporter substrate-binding protein [Conexibacter sp. CPCC 206217]|uniref:ABC transporter substrate-binding protein n=1 Tax=Conexibacter sp. CPCC 206217 TaxID=3064574 RepID=UPI002720D0F9|nr:ABC transporter substrate-binding protein [Conexibacter sp. CPCC 206217]MDO8208803.1 ABC transporter substrate-binding protein [Conexibacter sp. CPCC 206217]
MGFEDATTRRAFVRGGGRLALTAALGGVGANLLAGCGSDSGEAGATGATGAATTAATALKLGFAIGESGLMQPFDVSAMNMARLAIGDGPSDPAFSTTVSDTKSKVANAARAAVDVLSAGADVVVATSDYDLGAPIGLTCQQRGVLAMSPSAATTKWGPTGIGDVAFTMSNCAPAQAACVAQWAFEQMRWRSCYVLWDTSIAYQTDFKAAFEQEWTKRAGRAGIVGIDTFSANDASIATQVSTIGRLASPPDFIMLICYPPPAATALRQLRSGGVGVPVVGGISMGGDYWLKTVPNLSDFYNPAYASLWGDDPNPRVNQLVEAYKTKYGEVPLVSDAFLGYAMVEVLRAAALKAKSGDSKALVAAMPTLSDVDTIVGKTSFTAEQHYPATRPMIIEGVQGGRRTFVATVAPES